MSVDLIRYDLLVQDALRAVVRRVLTDVARDGLPGEHHLYVSFDTRAPGVRLSPRLKEKYPEEMTIVLQHQFWDLIVAEQFFEVGLSFNGIPERLHVPFDALKGFFDPSVKFGLQFEPPPSSEDEEAAPAPTGPRAVETAPQPVSSRPTSVPSTRPRAEEGAAAGKPGRADTAADKPVSAPAGAAKASPAKPAPAKSAEAPAAKAAARDEAAKERASKDSASKEDAGKDEAPVDASPKSGAQVVRLDAFRKK